MARRQLRTLILGLALFIIGPAIGFCGYLAILLRALPSGTRPSLAEALAQWQQLPGQLTSALVALAVGLFCGAVGFFMVIATLALHFFGGDPGKARLSEPRPQPGPASHAQTQRLVQPLRTTTAPVADDSRYMPKFQ